MNPRERTPVTPPVRELPADRTVISRELDSRKYEYRPPSQLPDTIRHPDCTFRWIRFRLKAGIDDPGNLSKQRRDGYEPIPFASRAEALVDPESVFAAQSGNIEIGDLVLCRRAAHISKGRKQYFEDLTAQQVRGAKNQVKKSEHEKYPGTISDSSSTSFARPTSKQVEFGED